MNLCELKRISSSNEMKLTEMKIYHGGEKAHAMNSITI